MVKTELLYRIENRSIFVTQFKGSRFDALNKIGFSFTLSEL
jgi:hypothetical protein